MKIQSLIFCFVLCLAAKGESLDTNIVNRIVAAIYKAEGGDKARKPFGILSVKVSSKKEAEVICRRTVTNNYQRWIKAGRTNKYLEFLCNRYCPKSSDPVGNERWLKNVKKISGLDF